MIQPPESLSPGVRRLAMLSHCFSLLGCFVPVLGHLLPALVMWIIARSADSFVEEHARESLNFQICAVFIFLGPSFLLLGLGKGGLWTALLFGIYYLATVLGCLIAASQVRAEKPFRHPLPFRLLR